MNDWFNQQKLDSLKQSMIADTKKNIKFKSTEKNKQLLDPIDLKRGWTIIGNFVCLDAQDDDSLKDMYRIPLDRYLKILKIRQQRQVPPPSYYDMIQVEITTLNKKMQPTLDQIDDIDQQIYALQVQRKNLEQNIAELQSEKYKLKHSECDKFGHDWEIDLYRQNLESDGKKLICNVCHKCLEIEESAEYLKKVRNDICKVTTNFVAKLLNSY